uniref:Uncharacterized protein n=1 Tax=Oryza rufipogon TaxID=4529 RepID=A0A0E0NIS9_ORYRU
MSTGLELGSGSGRAGGLPVGDRRSRRRRRHQELRLPAARRRRRGWKAVTLACHIYMGADKVWEFGCEATMFIVRSAFGRFLHQDNSGGGGGPLEQEFRTDAWPLLLDDKVSTNYT